MKIKVILLFLTSSYCSAKDLGVDMNLIGLYSGSFIDEEKSEAKSYGSLSLPQANSFGIEFNPYAYISSSFFLELSTFYARSTVADDEYSLYDFGAGVGADLPNGKLSIGILSGKYNFEMDKKIMKIKFQELILWQGLE
tara:strand:+ start:317 stop:733 length:417 start_codon:yes stop_codon:yes gene_type:complete